MRKIISNLCIIIMTLYGIPAISACGKAEITRDIYSAESISTDDNLPLALKQGLDVEENDSMGNIEKGDSMRTAYFAGGCFWGTEKFMSMVPGVVDVISGYANGSTKTGLAPSYKEVCMGDTGFRETVMVKYDPCKVSYEMLVKAYYLAIDPTVINRQGNDVGTQYQSGIYYVDEAQKEIAWAVSELIAGELEKHGSKLGVEIKALDNFYEAEEYHQDYLEKNPTGYCHINNEEIEDMLTMFREVGITKDKDMAEE